MSRHLERVVAVTAALAAAALTLTACGGAGGSADSTPDTSRLTIGVESDQAAYGYDPLRYSTGQRFFFEGVYDSLFRLDETGAVVPSLVTDFSYNDDSTQLTLDLDTTVTFDDGTALSADLVKQNFDFRDNPDLSAYNPFAAGASNEIADVSVVDDDTVTLTFAAASPGFESNLAFPAGAIVGPAGVADRDSLSTTPDGSGPLTVDAAETVKGNTYVLTKKEEHVGADAYPFDSYAFKIMDGQARVNAAISGEVDVAYLTTGTQDQATAAGVGLAANGGTVQNILPFDKNGTLAPQWGDVRVWKALSIAIDRETFVNAVHPGETPTWNVLPADSPGFITDLEDEYSYDPEAAKDLLAEAGYPDGFSFEMGVSPDSQRDLEALQSYWAAVGIDVTFKNIASTEEAFAAVRTQPFGGPIGLTWTNPASVVYGVLFGFANPHDAENGAIQAAIGAVGGASDDTAKAQALTDLNRAIVDSGWLIPLFEQFAYWAYNTGKVAEPTFPGAEPFPLLSTLTPAS